LVNPVFQPLIDSANAAIRTLVDKRVLSLIRIENHEFRVRIANPSQLSRYISSGRRPPRFPSGGRKRLLEVWRSRPEGAQIEVTEFMTIIGLRARESA
jgi:hypothetical protein